MKCFASGLPLLQILNCCCNNDPFKLMPKLGLNYVKSEAMFGYATPEVWNLYITFVS